jgi:glutamyl-tRNA synthetase
MRTRIAPTPSGYLHAGNGAAFIATWKIARTFGAKLFLRIDDLDAERARPEYVADIFETLRWLGVDLDEGPTDKDDFSEHWSQHLRLARYAALIDRLREGGHLYACDCSRAMIVQRGGSTEYDGHCRDRGLDMDLPEVSWRLRLPMAGTIAMRTWPAGEIRQMPLEQPDPVVRQRNGRPAYQIASLSDDVGFHVDLIVRGSDLLPSTLVQLHIAKILDLREFTEARFLHHPLLTDGSGGKLSKSHGAGSLKALRDAGGDPRTVRPLAEQMLRNAGAAVP